MVTDQNKSRDGSINELAASIALNWQETLPSIPSPAIHQTGMASSAKASGGKMIKFPRHRKQLRSCTISRHAGRRVRTNIAKGPTRA